MSRFPLQHIFLLLLVAALCAGMAPAAFALPEAKTGGAGGGPLSVLFVLGAGGAGALDLDATVAKELADNGYLTRTVSDREPLTADYLRRFNTVVVVGLENFNSGSYYNPNGITLLNTEQNVPLLRQFVQDGGGLIFVPMMVQAGSQYAETYNTMFAPWKMRFGWETVRDDAHQFADKATANYSWTKNITAHPVTAGVKALAYPTQLMRWDDAYPTTPLLPADHAWQVLARGEAGSRGMRNVNGKWAPADAGQAPALAAVRQAGKGRVGVVSLGGFYLLTNAFEPKAVSLGEATTGPLDGIAYVKGDGQTPSDWGRLFDNMLRWTAEGSTANGLGGHPEAWATKLHSVSYPDKPIPDFAVVNWKTQQLPTTWAHHAPNVAFWGGSPFYDEVPDPLVTHPQQMTKILIGAHSAYSDGKGTVAEWAKAARAAGFQAVIFTERFENLNGDEWPKFIAECKANSTPEFACLQGMDISDTFGNRYLILGNTNFPSGGMLTKDGKGLEMTARLSLGFSGHIAVMHRMGHDKTLPKELYRHFQGISIYTYARDEQGKFGLVDDAFDAYQWQLYNASNPVPIVVHELTDPSQVQTDGTVGFQQIVPAQDALDAIHYFRYGMDHFFENPQRYFITEGPLLTGWSIFNKDIGAPNCNRDHWRAMVGATAPEGTTISDAALYDRGQLVRHWLPNKPAFSELLDGEQGEQHYFMLVVTDSMGRRAISPHLRTVTRGYFTRCADRQNWFGAAGSYTGIWPSGIHGLWYISPEFPMGTETESFADLRPHPLLTVLSFPFASNAATITDLVIDKRYIDPTYYGMDAWRIENAEPTRTYEAHAQVTRWHDLRIEEIGAKYGKGMGMFAGAFYELTTVEASMRSRLAVTPKSSLFPVINNTPRDSAYSYYQGKTLVEGKLDGKAETLLDLPAGAALGDFFLLAPLTVSGSGSMGWRAEVNKEIPAGTEWKASYMYLLPHALGATLGGAPTTPWTITLTRGKVTNVLGIVNLTAENYAVAGRLKAGGEVKMLPVKVSGLRDNWPAALWTPKNLGYYLWNGLTENAPIAGSTSGPPFVAHIGVFQNNGYAALPNTEDTPFFIGNTLTAGNPALSLAYTLWTKDQACIEVHNPTANAITTRITSPKDIPGKYHVDVKVTVPAGSSVHLTLPKGGG